MPLCNKVNRELKPDMQEVSHYYTSLFDIDWTGPLSKVPPRSGALVMSFTQGKYVTVPCTLNTQDNKIQLTRAFADGCQLHQLIRPSDPVMLFGTLCEMVMTRIPPSSSACLPSLSSWWCCPIPVVNYSSLHLCWGLGWGLWCVWPLSLLSQTIWALLSIPQCVPTHTLSSLSRTASQTTSPGRLNWWSWQLSVKALVNWILLSWVLSVQGTVIFQNQDRRVYIVIRQICTIT